MWAQLDDLFDRGASRRGPELTVSGPHGQSRLRPGTRASIAASGAVRQAGDPAAADDDLQLRYRRDAGWVVTAKRPDRAVGRSTEIDLRAARDGATDAPGDRPRSASVTSRSTTSSSSPALR